MAKTEDGLGEELKVTTPQSLGSRYLVYEPIARGGMASVHLGRLMGADGFTRIVAVKQLHPHFAQRPRFVAMLQREAHVLARVRHPNVVIPHDVVATAPHARQLPIAARPTR